MNTRLVSLAALLIVLVSGIAAAIQPLPFKDAAQRERFQHLTGELRCMVCQNESLADSNAELAQDLRERIFHMMQDGKTDAEIRDFLVQRYSGFVLYKPPVDRGTWVLWFGPGLILALGGIGALVWLRRRATPGAVAVTEHTEQDWEENW